MQSMNLLLRVMQQAMNKKRAFFRQAYVIFDKAASKAYNIKTNYMAKYLNLQIPEACHEDWHAMLPDQKGKFCLSCQKQVVDFTSMSDTELIRFFKERKGNTCGRFTSEQLDRDMLMPRKPIPWINYFFHFSLPVFLLSFKGIAQKIKHQQVIEHSIVKDNVALVEIQESVSQHSITVQGSIKDDNGNPVFGATIFIKGTNQGTVADTSGNFILKEVKTPSELVVSAVGYEFKEVSIKPSSEDVVDLQLQIKLSTQMMGEVVVAGMVRPSRKEIKVLKKDVCIKPINPSLSVFPNPVQANNPIHLKWQALEAGNYVVELYSISGSLLLSQALTIAGKVNEYIIEPQDLKAGSYIAKLINKKNGRHLSQQLLVQE